MAVLAGNSAVIQISATDGSYTTIGHSEGPDFAPPQKEEIDTSACGEPAGSAIAGLTKFDGSLSCFYDPADAGQVIVMAQALSTGLAFIQILPAGTGAGWKSQCFVKDLKISGGSKDALKLSFSWRAVAAPSAVS